MKLGSDESEAMSEINVTPLVDVMLVLLVVFLVTAPLLTQTVGVNLPKTAAVAPNNEPKTINIGVDSEGKITLDQGPIADPAQLEESLRAAVAQNPEAHFHLHADQAASYGHVAKVMAATQRAGITKLAFVTTQE
ncbi:ExbD/TolR family protein [Methylolobus aquaticus]